MWDEGFIKHPPEPESSKAFLANWPLLRRSETHSLLPEVLASRLWCP
jgi:hypothetical protein